MGDGGIPAYLELKWPGESLVSRVEDAPRHVGHAAASLPPPRTSAGSTRDRPTLGTTSSPSSVTHPGEPLWSEH